MSQKLARETKVSKVFKERADFWIFSADLIIPLFLSLVVGFLSTLIFQLDYIWILINTAWPLCGWMLAVGNKSPGRFIADLIKVPTFGFGRKRRKRILRR
jgi:hypothetical protein